MVEQDKKGGRNHDRKIILMSLYNPGIAHNKPPFDNKSIANGCATKMTEKKIDYGIV